VRYGQAAALRQTDDLYFVEHGQRCRTSDDVLTQDELLPAPRASADVEEIRLLCKPSADLDQPGRLYARVLRHPLPQVGSEHLRGQLPLARFGDIDKRLAGVKALALPEQPRYKCRIDDRKLTPPVSSGIQVTERTFGNQG